MHKHADVLRAIAEGKPVEWKSSDAHRWVTWSGCGLNPIEHAHYDWRVKPEPKPDVVRYWGVSERIGYESFEKAIGEMKYHGGSHMVKLTFNAETGECKTEVVEDLRNSDY